ncbi:hypothetical protein Gasu2_16520 [Galdieria sulphuraria]|uniref:Uncharacterized protein n=1 Tax=Galdieria sulphuraria TaxID=130081 RepID=M2XX48_GALSU|nr:uncharacterized protein Gasu_43660 [Galdieria sulphuraria]EME28203.1 hypothetical protein Gasu_43660 [Galdieria sulphuraria]GJD07285.1 hypothetical protein Gasu2_16520 [Galdieria sulphuraria]|eukprot:XP_005704723.1 hypothetical protein Gasu_43660 [Galdieria sulphuraria]
MPDASVSSLVYKLATLQKKKNQGDSDQNYTAISEGRLPREPSPALLESSPYPNKNNPKSDSSCTLAYNSERKRQATLVDVETPSNILEEANTVMVNGPPNYGTSWFINICESCGAAHDGLYGSGRFCSKHCAKGVGARCKWNMVKANNTHSKEEYQYWSLPNTERKASDLRKTSEDSKIVKSSDPLRRLCLLAENEKKLLATEDDSQPEVKTKLKKRLYKYQLWLLEQQRNCYFVDHLQRGTDSDSVVIDESQMLEKDASGGNLCHSKVPEWNEIPLTTSFSPTSSYEEPTMRMVQEHGDFSVQILLNNPTESFESSSSISLHGGQWRLPPFTTLEKAAEQGDREFASRKWYRR